MAYTPIAFTAPNYRDYGQWWAKAYIPGTTTPKSMATDSTLSTLIAKAQVNADGFFVSAGSALIIPYIDGLYDLWLFPTEADADSNNTAEALRLADNITGEVSTEEVDSILINDLSQTYDFDTVAKYKAFTAAFPIGKRIYLKDRNAYFEVLGFTGLGNDFNIIDSDTVIQSISIVWISSLTIEQLGGVDSTGASPTTDCALIINECLPIIGHIELGAGLTYYTETTTYVDDYQLLTSPSEKNRATLKMNNPAFTGTVLSTVEFKTKAVNRVTIENIKVVGTLESLSVAEVDALTGDECHGVDLTINESVINHVTVDYAGGVGFLISNGGTGTGGLDANVNELYIEAGFTGQEGIIFDGGFDNKIEYMQSYFPWNSSADTDTTKTKVSKVIPHSVCFGVAFYRGSAEVIEMHPSNNRFGYAWGTIGQSGSAYRLRFARAIGEGSAGGVYLNGPDDVTGSLLNCHSTRGKSGLPLLDITSFSNVNIGEVDIKVDAQSGFPTDGTDFALKVDGERCVLPNVRIYKSGSAFVTSNVTNFKGSNHKIGLDIYSFKDNSTGGDSIAMTFANPSSANEIKATINECAVGLSGSSVATNPGVFDIKFSNTSVEDILSSYAGFLDDDFYRTATLNNTNTGRSTKERRIMQAITSAELDGTDRSFDVSGLSALFYQPTPKIKSLTLQGDTSLFRLGGFDWYTAGVTGDSSTVRYIGTDVSSGIDAEANMTVG